MKKLLFKYFNLYYYDKLVHKKSVHNNWLEPANGYGIFGYNTEKNSLFFNNNYYDEVNMLFNYEIDEYKDLLKEWFMKCYNLPVESVN